MIFALLFIVIAIGLCYYISQDDESEIYTWARHYTYEVISINRTIIDWGPFLLCNGEDRVYKVRVKTPLKDEKVVYFRFRLWSYEMRWENK